jgi:hypothetical protein
VKTALDTSVLLDVLTNDRRHAAASEEALRRAAGEGALLICECVVAEIAPALQPGEFVEWLADWGIAFVASDLESSRLAGEMFGAYLKRRHNDTRVLPDFLIGAHARCHADRLLARDRGYYRDYFKGLRLIEP